MKYLFLPIALFAGFNIFSLVNSEYLPQAQVLESITTISEGDGYTEQVNLVSIQKPNGEIESFKVASDVVVTSFNQTSEPPNLIDLADANSCISIKTYGVRIPHVSYRGISSFEETTCSD